MAQTLLQNKWGVNLAIETNVGHTVMAQNFLANLNNYWFLFAKTTAWDNESSPDAEVKTTTSLSNLLGIYKVTTGKLVYPVTTASSTTISYKNTYWEVAQSSDDALANNARYVYLESEISPDSLPYGQYRQVGIVSSPTVTSGKSYGKASEISNQGTLLGYTNELVKSYDSTYSRYVVGYIVAL